jgi:hypothetical protein
MGHSSTTKVPYVTVFLLGTAEQDMHNMVFDSSMFPPTPCVRRPNSFAADLSHVGNVSSYARRPLHYMIAPVVVWMTALAIGMWMEPVDGPLLGVGLKMRAHVRGVMLVNVTG